MIRIIDNKKIDLTDTEYTLYQKISKSYDRKFFKGEDLFKGLFETDADGKIIFLVPPSGKHFSMEVYLFLVNIMIHQHLGDACKKVENFLLEGQKTVNECKQALQKMKK